MIARYFVAGDGPARQWLLHDHYGRQRPRRAGRLFGKGGLMETMVLMNSLVAAAVLCVSTLLVIPGGIAPGVVMALAGMVAAWLVQKAVIRRCYARWHNEDQREKPKPRS